MKRIVVVMALIGLTVNVACAVDFEWFNGGNITAASNRTGSIIVSDPVGDQPLSGALFQLIRSVNGVNEAVQVSELGTGDGIGGGSDDAVVWTLWANYGAVGAGLMYDVQTMNALGLTDFVYVRVWDAVSAGSPGPVGGPSASTGATIPVAGDIAYWDSAPILVSSLPADGAGQRTLNFNSPTASPFLAYDGASHSGTWVVIPEPSVLAFLGIGGLVVAVRRRMQKA